MSELFTQNRAFRVVLVPSIMRSMSHSKGSSKKGRVTHDELGCDHVLPPRRHVLRQRTCVSKSQILEHLKNRTALFSLCYYICASRSSRRRCPKHTLRFDIMTISAMSDIDRSWHPAAGKLPE
jgi:hypothetical protein